MPREKSIGFWNYLGSCPICVYWQECRAFIVNDVKAHAYALLFEYEARQYQLAVSCRLMSMFCDYVKQLFDLVLGSFHRIYLGIIVTQSEWQGVDCCKWLFLRFLRYLCSQTEQREREREIDYTLVSSNRSRKSIRTRRRCERKSEWGGCRTDHWIFRPTVRSTIRVGAVIIVVSITTGNRPVNASSGGMEPDVTNVREKLLFHTSVRDSSDDLRRHQHRHTSDHRWLFSCCSDDSVLRLTDRPMGSSSTKTTENGHWKVEFIWFRTGTWRKQLLI